MTNTVVQATVSLPSTVEWVRKVVRRGLRAPTEAFDDTASALRDNVAVSAPLPLSLQPLSDWTQGNATLNVSR